MGQDVQSTTRPVPLLLRQEREVGVDHLGFWSAARHEDELALIEAVQHQGGEEVAMLEARDAIELGDC